MTSDARALQDRLDVAGKITGWVRRAGLGRRTYPRTLGAAARAGGRSRRLGTSEGFVGSYVEQQGHRRPGRRAGRYPLISAKRKTAVERGLKRPCAALNIPGAIVELGAQQKVDCPAGMPDERLRFRRRRAARPVLGPWPKHRLAMGQLRPTAVGALGREQARQVIAQCVRRARRSRPAPAV